MDDPIMQMKKGSAVDMSNQGLSLSPSATWLFLLLATPTWSHFMPPNGDIYKQISNQRKTFSLAQAHDFIMEFYLKKIALDSGLSKQHALRAFRHPGLSPLAMYLRDFCLSKYGSTSAADAALCGLLQCVKRHAPTNVWFEVFGLLIGLFEPESYVYAFTLCVLVRVCVICVVWERGQVLLAHKGRGR
jgi:hypothetical protein